MKYEELDVLTRISEEIYQLDMNFSDIAKEIGCNRRTLYHYADMSSAMNVQHLKKLCELTGKSADYFLYGKEL